MIIKLTPTVFINTDDITEVTFSETFDGIPNIRITMKSMECRQELIGDDALLAYNAINSVSTVNMARIKNEAYDLKQCITAKEKRLKGQKHD